MKSRVEQLLGQLNEGKPHFPLDKAIPYATGTKDEVYCKGVGLVHLLAKHNDKTESTVKLIRNNRTIDKDSYNVVTGGDWTYQVDTGYREAKNSRVWMDRASIDSYKMREVRALGRGHSDRGRYKGKWKEGDRSFSYHGTGDVKEPVPLFLASDFHLWGAWDLGFKIEFRKGFTDKMNGRESGAPKDIVLKTTRTVKEKMPSFSFKDVSGRSYTYNDCYRVQSVIELDRLEDRKGRSVIEKDEDDTEKKKKNKK